MPVYPCRTFPMCCGDFPGCLGGGCWEKAGQVIPPAHTGSLSLALTSVLRHKGLHGSRQRLIEAVFPFDEGLTECGVIEAEQAAWTADLVDKRLQLDCYHLCILLLLLYCQLSSSSSSSTVFHFSNSFLWHQTRYLATESLAVCVCVRLCVCGPFMPYWSTAALLPGKENKQWQI